MRQSAQSRFARFMVGGGWWTYRVQVSETVAWVGDGVACSLCGTGLQPCRLAEMQACSVLRGYPRRRVSIPRC